MLNKMIELSRNDINTIELDEAFKKSDITFWSFRVVTFKSNKANVSHFWSSIAVAFNKILLF